MVVTNTQYSAGERSGDISVRDLLTPLFRRKRLLLVTFFSVLALAIGFAALTGPTYASHMAILVDRERLDPLVSTEATSQMITTNTPVAPEEVNSEIELLTSRDVLERVVVANGLDKPTPGFSLGNLLHPNQTEQDRVARAVKLLAKKLKPEVTTKTNIISVTYKSTDPQLSYGVLHSLGDFYVEKHVAVHRPAGSYSFFAAQTLKYQDKLKNAETTLRDFAKQNGVAAPDIQRTNLALQAADSIGAMHMVEQAIAADEERIKSDQQQMSSTPQRSTTLQASATNEKLIGDLNSSLITDETRRTDLAMKYDASYPLVKEVDAEITQIRDAINKAESQRYVTETTDRDATYELLREDMAKAQSDLAAQRATLSATHHSIASMQMQMVNLDQQSLDQQDLIREAKADESNYLLYLGKREQERTTDALDNTRISNIAIAVPPAIPVLPIYSWPMILLVAFVAATVISLVATYVIDYLDSSFHTPTQVVDLLGIPLVVTIAKKTA